jgi:ankyrin repeat protein
MEDWDLYIAVANGSLVEATRLLALGRDPNASFRGKLYLNVATVCNNYEMVAVLLRHGADPNLRVSTGENSLYCAVGQANESILGLLIAHGGRIDEVFECGNLIATAVLWEGAEKIIPVLVSLGLDINQYNPDGFTPLMLAAANGCKGTIGVLVQHGAAIEARDSVDGWTPYLHAVGHGMRDEERQLIELGADVGVFDRHGRSAEMIRQEYAKG